MIIVGGFGVIDAVEQTHRISNAHRLDYVRRAIDAHAIKDGFAGTELGLAGDPSNLAFNGTVTLYLGNCVLPSVAIDIMPSTAPDQNPRLVAEIAGYHATINGSHHDFADYAALQGQTSMTRAHWCSQLLTGPLPLPQPPTSYHMAAHKFSHNGNYCVVAESSQMRVQLSCTIYTVGMSLQPLAEKMRPVNLADVVGQQHLVAAGKIIHQIVAGKQPTSLILWGPPGSGKTTLARIIARETGAEFVELSAVTSGKADVMKVIDRAAQNRRLAMTTILFVDEIHRFNKAQQDAFLPHVEDGTIVLIGATTENPSFEVITPLLSRSRVLVLEPHTKTDIVAILQKAAKAEKLSAKQLPAKSIDLLAELSGGDARVALGNLELALQLAGGKPVSPEVVKNAAQKRVPGYDKAGEQHYNVISAFIKSMRGSDATAALYYMARMLQAGEDPKFIARRMVIFASEDIGLAAPAALNLAVSTFLAVERIGLPECEYNLYHCATVLAKSQKSRVVADAMSGAKALARDNPDLPVPLHLRNAPTKLMKDLGYNQGYQWQADFKHPDGFLPDQLKGTRLFPSRTAETGSMGS